MIATAFPKKHDLDQMTFELKESQKRFKREAAMALQQEQEKMLSNVKSINADKQNLAGSGDEIKEDDFTDKNSSDE